MPDPQEAGASNTEASPTLLGTPEPAETPAGEETGDLEKVVAPEGEPTEKPAGEEAPDEPVYEFKYPEGYEPDEASVAELVEFAKEVKLPPEAAQKLLDKRIEAEKSEAEAFAKQQADWQAEFKKDPKWEEKLADARRAVNRFGKDNAKATELLLKSPLGNHPALLNFLAAIGAATNEAPVVTGKESIPEPQDIALRMFPNTKMNP